MPSTEAPWQGVRNSKPTVLNTQNNTTEPNDPFGGHRDGAGNPLGENGGGKAVSPASPTSSVDRRASSDEWDASKTPPSRFQQRKGSLYATPGSRDGHVDKNYERDAKFHEFHEKKYGSGKRRPSSSKGSEV